MASFTAAVPRNPPDCRDHTSTIRGIAGAYRAASTDAMQSGWARMSARHVDEVVDGCHLLANALDVAAGYIVAQKAEAVAVLIGMAVAFAADQAAAVATARIAEAAAPVIIEGARRLVRSLIMDLQQHVIAEVLEAAAQPLFAKVEAAMAGLDWSQSGGGVGLAEGVHLDPEALAQQTAVLREHGTVMRQHGARYRAAVAGLDF